MTLRELVTLARGPIVGADLRAAEVARLPADRSGGQLAEAIRVPLDSSYLFERDSLGAYVGPVGLAFPPAGSAAELALQPYDQVTVFRQPQFELQRAVQLTGEVAYPGTYALRRRDERMSDLVRRAGGLLSTAYPDGARFYRHEEALRPANGAPVDTLVSVNIELGQVLGQPGSPNDVVLQPKDSLHIPEYLATVRVEGAVTSPTSVLYRERAGLDYYVANAGGYTRNADQGRVSVRYAKGSARVKSKFLFFSSSPRPRPGSVVTVPRKPEGEPFNLTQLLGTVAQVLASTVAIVAIATR